MGGEKWKPLNRVALPVCVFSHTMPAIFNELSSTRYFRSIIFKQWTTRMQANGFFEGIGEAIGDAIRVVVEFLVGLFTNFFGAFDDFIGGLTRSLGINDSF